MGAVVVHQHCHLSQVTSGTCHCSFSPVFSLITSYTRHISLELFIRIVTCHRLYQAHITGVVHQHCHLSQVTPGTYHWSCSPTLSPVTSYTRYLSLELFTNIVTCHKLYQIRIIGAFLQHCHLSQVTPSGQTTVNRLEVSL